MCRRRRRTTRSRSISSNRRARRAGCDTVVVPARSAEGVQPVTEIVQCGEHILFDDHGRLVEEWVRTDHGHLRCEDLDVCPESDGEWRILAPRRQTGMPGDCPSATAALTLRVGRSRRAGPPRSPSKSAPRRRRASSGCTPDALLLLHDPEALALAPIETRRHFETGSRLEPAA
jgi:hypothetical protein